MNPFDLGAEVFILPILWGILALTVVGMLATSFKRNKVEVYDDDGETVIYDKTEWKSNKRRLRRAAMLASIGALVLSSVVIVPPGHRGAIYTTSGVSTHERGEGYSLMLPVLHNANMVNVREQKYQTINEDGEPTLFAQTQDVLEVPVNVAINYRVDPDQAADIFKNVGQSYEEQIIWPAVLGVVTGEFGQVDAAEIPNKRFILAQDILEGLDARLRPVGILVTSVQIQDTQFPTEFTAAVLAKEVAEEKQQETQRLIEVAQNEATAVERRADGDAYAIAKIATAREDEQDRLGMSPTEYVWFQKWNGVLPSTLLGDGDGFIVNLPEGQAPAATTDEE